MTWFDLASGRCLHRGVIGHVLAAGTPLSDIVDITSADITSAGITSVGITSADITRPAGAALAVRFDRFSDGRGFTVARHLREALGVNGPLVAQGQLIPDQADYLRRCGFTHVEISLSAAPQWRRSLALTPPAMQRVLATPRARSRRSKSLHD